MSTKLVIENREFYFHPTHQAYAGSIDGCVVHVVTREPTFGRITEKGYFEMIVQDYWVVSMFIILYGSVFMDYLKMDKRLSILIKNVKTTD